MSSTPAPQNQFKLKLSETPSPYLSPLFKQWPKEHWPQPIPACATCPASMWRVTNSRIDCLCRSAHKISWDGRQEPTLFCDGRESAIEKLKNEADGAM